MKEKEIKSAINKYIIFWILGIILVSFFGGLIFGDYYTEYTVIETNCSEVTRMIILNDFPGRQATERVLVDTFYADRMSWAVNSWITNDYYREYYLENCVKDAYGQGEQT